ncbi:MAG TPA: hypothetical protein VGL81_31015 [Polyangiaceae bacterium]
MRGTRVATCAAAAIVLVASTGRAAPTKEQCIDANSNAQQLRRESKLLSARQALLTCSEPSCPAIVRNDCAARLDEVQKAQPTLVLDVKSRGGDDLTDVKVTLDGAPFSVKLDGTAVAVDPGQHTFTFEADGFESVTKTLVLKETEKDRRERIVLRRTPKVAPEGASTGSPAPLPDEPIVAEPAHGLGTQRWLAIAVGAAGLAGVAVGSVFGLKASSDWSAQQSACGSPSSCPDHAGAVTQHANLTTDSTISTWAFIGGGALVASGVLLLLTAPSRHAPPSTGFVVVPAAGPRSASLELSARFW